MGECIPHLTSSCFEGGVGNKNWIFNGILMESCEVENRV